MSSSSKGGEDREGKGMDEQKLKEGERIVGPTRRPDGTLRKPIRIRPGYNPQDEVAIYQSRGSLWKKELESQVGPPGYDPNVDAKPKTKSAKRNERKKEKRLQAAAERDKNSESGSMKEDEHTAEPDTVKSLTSQINDLSVTSSHEAETPSNLTEASDPASASLDIDKKIRALKKKIRLTEAQQQKTGAQDLKPDQLEKFTKLKGWHEELKLLESKKSELEAP